MLILPKYAPKNAISPLKTTTLNFRQR